jgi:hypothetical protein
VVFFFLGLRHDHHFRNGIQEEEEKLRTTQIVKGGEEEETRPKGI